ncbi:DUF3558 domain-containing protein [Streptomyces millisiae]|uniref:DUF3558 domain-containing protein n=1 Tax=Streptomyces millisiae TaxID=3075542 RepID=A0ABU2LV81_9ACTN|nr:DUF3558 domain-containing protein [Streptomyces sp. DSM 44918]MDT0321087.1 DUF3558 domain-containing protein [Streptomyces sp. DSM 44918]
MQRAATIRTAKIRRAVAATLAAVAVLGIAGACEAGLGTDDASGPGDAAGTVGARQPQPGRFSVLPEPCGSVPVETLRELLPEADDEVYAGQPQPTFDTGRRVGCVWHHATANDSQRLDVDFRRIVSYTPDISDDDQAEIDFEAHAADAGVSVTSPQSPADPLAARLLDGIGHVAFIDSTLTSDNAQDRRDVEVAFRTANVIVTVNYTVSTTGAGGAPDNALLQQQAQGVAQRLAGGFDG